MSSRDAKSKLKSLVVKLVASVKVLEPPRVRRNKFVPIAAGKVKFGFLKVSSPCVVLVPDVRVRGRKLISLVRNAMAKDVFRKREN